MRPSNDVQVNVAAEYLKARARADSGDPGCSPDSLMFFKAAELLISQLETISTLRDRLVKAQRQVQEYECREMGA